MSALEYGTGLPRANAEIQEARHAAAIRLLNERSYEAAIAATDGVVWRLEELNLEGRGKEQLRGDTASQIERALSALPKGLRPKIRTRTVQGALDAVLDVQEPLLKGWRQAHRSARLASPVLRVRANGG